MLNNILNWLTNFKISKTELPDPSNYVQIDVKKKNNKECKNNESHTFIIGIFMKIVFIIAKDTNSSTIVFGVEC